MSIWAKLQHFTAAEFEPLSEAMDPILLRKLDDTRHIAGVPIHVTSAVRLNQRSDTDSEHIYGEGVDIADNKKGDDISSRWRYHILRGAYAVGFSRIGIYDRHIHLGVSKTKDQEVAWLGKSK